MGNGLFAVSSVPKLRVENKRKLASYLVVKMPIPILLCLLLAQRKLCPENWTLDQTVPLC